MGTGMRWLLSLLVALLVPCGGAGARAPEAGEPSASPLLQLREAIATVTVDGVTRVEAVTLPYHWDRLHDWRAGEARFDVPFALASPPVRPWGLFIARAGSSFDVTLNGDLLQTYGDPTRGNRADYAKAPVYVALPAHLLKAGANSLQIRIRADIHRQAGMSPLVLGPAKPIRDLYFEPTFAWRFTGSVLLAAFAIVVGVTALALWITQAGTAGRPSSSAAPAGRLRRDNLYFWAALVGLCCALRVADGAIRSPLLPWPEWGALMTACTSGWAGAAVMFCQHLAGVQDRPGMRWLHRAAVVVFTMPAIACWLALSRVGPHGLAGWLVLETAAVTGYVLFFVGVTVRRPNAARVLVAGIAVLTLAIGARDWMVMRLDGAYGETAWVRYASVLFGIALLAIVLERFREASMQARSLLQTLAARVADRERELAAAYARLEANAREQARTQERERILADMHDSVGLRITGAIHQIQSGRASRDELLSMLRDSLDQLKLSIDAIHLPPGDVEALLAGLRYRLGPRFEVADLVFEWGVQELSPVARLDGDAMRHLQFLLFEAISNVLQHARARTLRIEAEPDGGGVRIRVIDDGRGFDAAAALPRSMQMRAAALGAKLAVESRPGRTVVGIAIA